MAVQTAVFTVKNVDLTAVVGASGNTADLVLGINQVFNLTSTGPINIRFGDANTIANATASNFQVPGNIVVQYDTGQQYDRIRIFNPGAGNTTYWIQVLSRF